MGGSIRTERLGVWAASWATDVGQAGPQLTTVATSSLGRCVAVVSVPQGSFSQSAS